MGKLDPVQIHAAATKAKTVAYSLESLHSTPKGRKAEIYNPKSLARQKCTQILFKWVEISNQNRKRRSNQAYKPIEESLRISV